METENPNNQPAKVKNKNRTFNMKGLGKMTTRTIQKIKPPEDKSFK